MDDDAIRDMFTGLGTITVKRMFGGKGIYSDGFIVALEVGGEVLLKADAASAPDFEAAGSTQWIYEGKNKPVAMPYWSIPDEAIDDPDELSTWTRKALEASRRAAK